MVAIPPNREHDGQDAEQWASHSLTFDLSCSDRDLLELIAVMQHEYRNHAACRSQIRSCGFTKNQHGRGLLSDVPQDLVMLLDHVVQDLRRAARVPIELTLPSTGSALSLIDPDAFAILVRNLIENALKYGSRNLSDVNGNASEKA